MAMARKCDICGSYYENYGRNTLLNIPTEPNSIVLANNKYFSSQEYSSMGHYDCCPDCMDSIKEHLKSLGLKLNDKEETKKEQN